MATGRRELVEVTYRDLRVGDRDGQLMRGRRIVGAPRPLTGGRVEITTEWSRTGKRETLRPQASRKVQVERVVEGLRYRAKARTTGGQVEVWDTEHADSPITADQVRGHRWAMRCEHGTAVGRRTYDEAMDDVRDPRLWCVDCVPANPRAGAGALTLPLPQ